MGNSIFKELDYRSFADDVMEVIIDEIDRWLDEYGVDDDELADELRRRIIRIVLFVSMEELCEEAASWLEASIECDLDEYEKEGEVEHVID